MSAKKGGKQKEEVELRRGPWTLEEDSLLVHYIARHGEGRWNLLAKCSGLKRTGKSCRLRWLNYLKPDVKRGNLSPEEQFLILELHSKWGNRWSRIAQYLPGRTDNEIKNYWRTRVQKQARQLNIDAGSSLFRDAVRCHWMPRLLEKMASNTLNIESTNQTCNTSEATHVQTQHSNNLLPQEYYYTDQFSAGSANCSAELGQNAPCTFSPASTSAPLDSLVSHGVHGGYRSEGVDLVTAAGYYSSPSDGVGEGGQWMDGLWTSMDDLWQYARN